MSKNFEKLYNNISSLIDIDNDEIGKENANMNADTMSGMAMKIFSETSKQYAMDNLISDKTKKLIEDGLLHVHDMDCYLTKSTTCLQHPLDKILRDGTRVGHCAIRPAKRIETASALACIVLQGVQNVQHGGLV